MKNKIIGLSVLIVLLLSACVTDSFYIRHFTLEAGSILACQQNQYPNPIQQAFTITYIAVDEEGNPIPDVQIRRRKTVHRCNGSFDTQSWGTIQTGSDGSVAETVLFDAIWSTDKLVLAANTITESYNLQEARVPLSIGSHTFLFTIEELE